MKIIANGKYWGESYDIGKIVIYENGEELFTNDGGTLEIKYFEKRKSGSEVLTSNKYHTGEIMEICLAGEIKRANKLNLNRKDNFTIKYHPEYYPAGERKTALYIHASEISVIPLGDILAMETEEEKNYLRAAKLQFKNNIIIRNYFIEKMPCENFTLPEGCRWGSGFGTKEYPIFDTYDTENSILRKKRGEAPEKGVIKRWMERAGMDHLEIIAAERYYTKTEYTGARIEKNRIAEALNNSGLFYNQTFSHCDIDKMMKVLNISLKEDFIK